MARCAHLSLLLALVVSFAALISLRGAGNVVLAVTSIVISAALILVVALPQISKKREEAFQE